METNGVKLLSVDWIRKRTLTTRIVHTLTLATVLTVGSVYCPTPWALFAPGPSYHADRLVHVKGLKVYPKKGHLVLLTVVSEPANLLYCVYALFDSDAQLVSKSVLEAIPSPTPQAQSSPEPQEPEPTTEIERNQRDARQMHLSQSVSSAVALFYILSHYPDMVKGLVVNGLIEGGPNATTLHTKDILLKLDGHPIRNPSDVAGVVRSHSVPGDIVADIEREGHPLQLRLKVWQNQGRPMIGANFSPAIQTLNNGPFNLKIDSERVSGASGGLIFCLELINELTPQDLTQGRIVAGTGTLGLDGQVGPIQGVRFKFVAAQRAGASIFLCPKDNLAELAGLDHTGVEIVPVSTLADALQALRKTPP